MNPFLAIGQIIVSIALIAAILLQARGTGLSGTFGGDSAVYRSRRGVERRLWQFTIILLVLFVAVLARVVHLRPDDLSQVPGRPAGSDISTPHESNRPCRHRRPPPASRCDRAPDRRAALLATRPRRRRPSRSPPTSCRTARASSAGPSRSTRWPPGPRPTATSLPSCSRGSSHAARTGRSFRGSPSGGPSTRPAGPGPSRCDPDARWQDGTPVTAQDVVYTVNVLRNPEYTGPGAGSWREVTATIVDEQTVRFELDHAARRVPRAGHPADRTGPPPRDASRSSELADDPFGRAPIGSGPYVLTELDDDHAVLMPAASVDLGAPGAEATTAPVPSDPLATITPTRRPDVAAAEARPPRVPLLRRSGGPRVRLRGRRARRRLRPAHGRGRRPRATAWTPPRSSAIPAPRCRPCSSTSARPTRSCAIRPSARRCSRPSTASRSPPRRSAAAPWWPRPPIPPTSWAFDTTASAAVATDATAATAALTKAGWTKVDERWRPPGAKEAYTLEILSPDAEMNPALFAVAQQVAEDWDAFGLSTEVVQADASAPMAERLRKGEFAAAVVDISIGHDPDLYPLLASSQTQTGGLNVAGVQDAALDALLVGGPATRHRRGPEGRLHGAPDAARDRPIPPPDRLRRRGRRGPRHARGRGRPARRGRVGSISGTC